jgi:hypothetical protein
MVSSSKVSKVRSNNAGGILMLNRACLVKIMGLLSEVTKHDASCLLHQFSRREREIERQRETKTDKERRTTHSASLTYMLNPKPNNP